MKSGICVSKGYAIGKAFLYKDIDIQSFTEITDQPDEEIKRLTYAVEESKNQLLEAANKARSGIGLKEAGILESHISFLNDPELIGKAFKEILNHKKTAEKAISDVVCELASIFSNFDDEYMKERSADINDVGARLIRILTGASQDSLEDLPENSIIITHDLKPSDTARIDKTRVFGFITETGGLTSHTAIMARAMNIAAIVGFQGITSIVKTGDDIIIDGINGDVLINPDAAAFKHYEELRSQYLSSQEKLREALIADTVIKNGKKITIAANIESVAEADAAIHSGAEAVGLFRTEFIFMGRDSMPGEEEQFEVYKQIVQRMGDLPVTIRTIDIGGDKSLPYLNIPKEMNPFLGLRAIRLSLRSKDIFKTQLRAILRASVFGNIRIMFPMIGRICELDEAKSVVRKSMEELDSESVAYDREIKIGMMIEVPSAAIMAEEFAKKVDFFSIGSNDLTQYTLAVDRMNENISDLYDPLNPAVLRLINGTILAAHDNGIPCCMCGEMAADFSAIPILLEYGLDEFSVSPASVPEVKNFIINWASQ